MLIETFIPGQEYAVEGVLTDGAFRPFAIFDKPDPLDGPFFEETIYVTPSRARRRDAGSDRRGGRAGVAGAGTASRARARRMSRKRSGSVTYWRSPPRPIGGLCSRAIRFTRRGREIATLEEVLLRHAVGESVGDIPPNDRSSGVMMIPIPRRGSSRGKWRGGRAQRGRYRRRADHGEG